MGVASTAAIISAFAAVGGATVGVVSAVNQQRDARIARDRQQQAIDSQQNALTLKTEQDKAIAKRDQQRAEFKAGTDAYSGRQGTILTSPLGVVGSPTTTNKTLLGG